MFSQAVGPRGQSCELYGVVSSEQACPAVSWLEKCCDRQ